MHGSRILVHLANGDRPRKTAPNRRHAPANVPYTSDGFVSIHDPMAVAGQRFDLVL